MGIPQRLTAEGLFELDPERPASNMLELFTPMIPIDSTKVALGTKDMLEFQMNIPFLRLRHISDVLKSYRARCDSARAINFTMDDIEQICAKLKSKTGITSMISDQLDSSLSEIMPWLASEVVVARNLRVLRSKGQLNKAIEKDEHLSTFTSVHLEELCEDKFIDTIWERVKKLDDERVTVDQLFNAVNGVVLELLPACKSDFPPKIYEKVRVASIVGGEETPMMRIRETAKVAYKCLLEVVDEELQLLFDFFLEKQKSGLTMRQMLKETPPQSSAPISRARSRPAARETSFLFTNKFLQETRRKAILIQIARIVVVT